MTTANVITLSFVATRTAAEVANMVGEIAKHETKGKALIKEAAFEVLAHVLASGNNTWATNLANALTPANRSAFVLLVKELAGFSWSTEKKAFGKKSKNVDERELQAKQAQFLTKYQGSIWAWYEDTKAKDIEQKDFNPAALVKVLAAFYAQNGIDGDALLAEELNKAKAEAKVVVSTAERINEVASQLLERNPDMTKKDAQAKAKRQVEKENAVARTADVQGEAVAA